MSRSTGITPVDNVTSVRTDVLTGNVAVKLTKPTLSPATSDSLIADHAAVVCPDNVDSQQTPITRRAVNADVSPHGNQLTATRSLVTLSQHTVQPSRSTDRVTLDTRPVAQHGTNVQRSHSFTNTSHQHPPITGLAFLFHSFINVFLISCICQLHNKEDVMM